MQYLRGKVTKFLRKVREFSFCFVVRGPPGEEQVLIKTGLVPLGFPELNRLL